MGGELLDAERVVVAGDAAAGCRRSSASRSPGPCAAGSACRTASASASGRPCRRRRRDSEIVPPRRTASIAKCSAASRSTPAGLHQLLRRPRRAAGPCHLVGELRDRRAVRLHPDGVDHGSPRRGRRSASRIAPTRRRRARSGRAPARRGRGRARAARARGRRRCTCSTPRCWAIRVAHLADRPEAEHEQAAAGGHVGVLDRLPGGRQHVGEVDEAVVRRALGDLDRPVLGLRHAQVARPGRRAPGRRASCSRTARRPSPGRAPASSRTATAGRLSHMKQWPQEMLNGITTRSPGVICVTSAPTSSTMPIGSWPRMSPGVDERAHDLVEVQVGAADAGRRDLDDRVGRMLEHGIGHRLHAHVALALPGQRLHSLLLGCVLGRAAPTRRGACSSAGGDARRRPPRTGGPARRCPSPARGPAAASRPTRPGRRAPTRDLQRAAAEDAAGHEVGGVAEDDPARADVDRVRRARSSHVPSPPTSATTPVTTATRATPPNAIAKPSSEERDRVADQVVEAAVQERRPDDAVEPVDLARLDPVARPAGRRRPGRRSPRPTSAPPSRPRRPCPGRRASRCGTLVGLSVVTLLSDRIALAGVARRRLQPRLRAPGRRPAVLRGLVPRRAGAARRARGRQRGRQVDAVPHPRRRAPGRRRRRRHRHRSRTCRRTSASAPDSGRTVRELLLEAAPARLREAGERMLAGRARARGRRRSRGRRDAARARRSATGRSSAATSSRGSGTRPAGGSSARRSTRSARARRRELSGGERKRLVLDVLFASEAAVLLLDEPDNFLDVPAKLELERRIAGVEEDGAADQPRPRPARRRGRRDPHARGQRHVDARRLLPHLSRGARAPPAAARRPARAVEARGAAPVPVLQDDEAARRDLRRATPSAPTRPRRAGGASSTPGRRPRR